MDIPDLKAISVFFAAIAGVERSNLKDFCDTVVSKNDLPVETEKELNACGKVMVESVAVTYANMLDRLMANGFSREEAVLIIAHQGIPKIKNLTH